MAEGQTEQRDQNIADPLKSMVNVVKVREKFIPGEDENKAIKNLVGICIDKSDHSRLAFDCNFFLTEGMWKTCTDRRTSKWKEAAEDSYHKCQELINNYKDLCVKGNIAFEIHLGSKQHHKIGAEILQIVDERGIQWIIMGTRGLDTIRRTILGSVSDYLLHHSLVPVTIVPPP